MVFKKDLIKKYKIYTIRKDIKNLKYVKTIKMYKILTLIHLNYKINKITFKNIQDHGLTDCLAKGVKILELHEIHLNYKFKKITFKNIQIHGLSDCLAKRVKILDGMKCSPLFAPIPLDIWKSEIQLSSGIIAELRRPEGPPSGAP